jgi:hypothetical protein
MGWKSALQVGRELVLVSTDSVKPHAIVVISQGMMEGRILIGACEMKRTLRNISRNKNVCIITKYRKEYYRVSGNATVHPSGKFFDSVQRTNKGPVAKKAIAITVKEVVDIDSGKKIV